MQFFCDNQVNCDLTLNLVNCYLYNFIQETIMYLLHIGMFKGHKFKHDTEPFQVGRYRKLNRMLVTTDIIFL